MSKFNTFLVVIGMVCLAFSTNAQISFTFVPSNPTPDLGETITVDAVVTGFTDVASYQFSINWNENALSYQGVSNFNLTGLSAGNFGTTQSGNGILTTSWSDPFAGVQSLVDGTTLFTITYEVVAASATTTSISFSETPLGFEVIADDGSGLTDVTGTTTFNDTSIDIDGGGVVGGIPCNFAGFGLTVTSDSAATGEQVCLDVAACNFTDLVGMSYTMQFDPSTLQFDEVNNLNLEDLEAGSFGTNNAGNGFVTLAWFDPEGTGVTVADETVIYSICFTAIGAGGETDSLLINGALAPIDVTDTGSNGNNIGLESIDGEVTITGTAGSAVTLIASQGQGVLGDTVSIDISVRNFDSITSIQSSMLWDPAIIDFFDVQSSGVLPTDPTFNTSSTLTDAGKLTFIWEDPMAQGIDIMDDEIIFTIRYIIVGEITEVSVVDFTDDPTGIEVTQVNDGVVEIVPLAKIPGLVEVVGEGVLTLTIGQVSGMTGDTVCVPVTVENFNEIVSMEYDVTWDNTELTYINVQDFNLSGLQSSNFNPIGSNKLRLSWFEPLLDPQTLLDGDTLYTMCFEILGPDGTSTDISFDQTATIEITDGTVPVPNNVVDGGITVSNNMAQLEVSDTSITNVLCFGDATGAIDIEIANASGVVTYMWTGGATTQDISNLEAGTYTVTVSDDDETITETYTITEPASALSQTTSGTDVTCNGDDDGEATVTPSGGTAPYSYLWSNAGITQTISDLAPNTYNVTVTDDNGCTITASVLIAEPTALSVSMSAMDVTTNGGSNGEATATPSGGTAPYDYLWSNAEATQTITGLTAGTYTVTVTDDNGCTIVDDVIVSEPGAMTASIDGTNVSCNGADDGEATVNTVGGVAPYDYNWSPSAPNAATITDLAADVYNVTVTDDNGNTATASVTITEPTVLSVNIDDNNLTCNGADDGTANATPAGGTAPYDYLWSPGGAVTAMITGLEPGTYTVTITDDNGCTVEESTDISEPAVLTVSGNVTHESGLNAEDGAITVTPAGGTSGYMYAWSPGGANTPTITGLAPGNYTVTVTDDNDCTVEETFTVNQFAAPEITVENVTNIDCNGDNTGAIDISVTGGLAPYDYNWSPGGAISQDISNLTAGNYTVTVTDDNGTTAVETITVNEEDPIVILLSGQNNLDCNGDNNGSIDITVSGGNAPYTYDWGAGGTNEDPSNLSAGTYTPTITDDNGCTQIGSPVTITEPAPINITVVSSTNVTCNGDANGALDIDVTGGTTPYTYNWNAGLSDQADHTDLPAGTYTVTISDANGCTEIGPSITISEPPALIASSSFTAVSCNGGNDGTITLNVSGGVTPYTSYNWSPNLPNQPNQTGLSAGTYNVTITDALGCTVVEGPIPVTQPAPLTVSNTVTNASAANDDGAIDITVLGGTPNYNYTWNNGETTEDLSGLASGCYVVTVEDNNGCSVVDSIKVGGIIVITNVTTDVSCAGSCDGSIDISILGGIAPYTYTWAGPDVIPGAEDQDGLCAGNYAVTVADSNGSLTSETFTIGTPTALTLSTFSIQDETGDGCNGSINITVTGGTQPYTYQWSNGATNEDPVDLCKGNYTVTIVDANGCILISPNFTVMPPPLVVAMSNMTMALCNGDATGEVCFSVLGGCAPYTVTVNGEQQVSVSGDDICFDELPAGTYDIEIVDAGSPQMDLTVPFTITEPDAIVISITNLANNTDPTGMNCNGVINTSVSGGTGTYTYQWSHGPTTPDVGGLCEDLSPYCVTVFDANGCTTELCGIEINLGLNIQVVSTEDVSCFDECDGTINIDVFGGEAPYEYIWGPTGQTTQDVNNLCADTYIVTVTDNAGLTATTTVTIDQPTSALTVTEGDVTRPTNDNANGSIALTISGGWGNETISWTGPNGYTGIGQVIGGLGEGFYTATVTDENGCVEIITINLPAYRLELDFELVQPTCNGDDDGTIELFVSEGSGDYTITWDNGQGGDFIFELTAGDYTVTVQDNAILGLSTIETVTLSQPDPLEVTINITNATGPADGVLEAVATGGNGGYTYLWNTPNADITPIVTRLPPGSYGVVVNDEKGCQEIVSPIEVEIMGECLEARKVISPNGDGKNDELIISCVEGLDNNLKIFNRWGQMVYEVDNYDNTWMGTEQDGTTLLPESGYFWVLEYQEAGQTIQLKGAFTLLRGQN